MKSGIREKRKLVISKKRITTDKIRELAIIIDREANQTNDNTFLIFSADAIDNSSYESQSIIIFSKNGLIEKKVIHKINMRFNTLDYNKSIEIQLLQSQEDENNENNILVSGDDPTWVNGVIAELSEVIELAEKQTTKRNFIGWSITLCWIVFIILYWRLICMPLTVSKNSWLQFFLGIVIPFGSILYAISLVKYLQALWPVIELQTGPNHMRMAQLKRSKVQHIFLLILIPLILAAVYDVIKSLVIK